MLAVTSCKRSGDSAPYNCTSAAMQLQIAGKTVTMRVVNNTLFRSRTDTGKFKLMSLEALSDSVRLVLNIKDGPYEESSLGSDAMQLKTYSFAKGTSNTGGFMVLGVKSGSGYRFADTDTSAITITKISPEDHIISGTYYFEADNRTTIGKGTFTNVCFSSLK
ncbi:hypothetical protein CK934_05605 [Chitinophaga sp. MD30]|nr:hypothetical protein CK934_05605 [Chitinophaga sp. MD30]